jgi:hypothetical protein
MAQVESQAGAVGTSDFIVKREHNRLREMWCAARLGVGFNTNFSPCQVDIEERDEQREYDFHLCVNGKRLPFQIVEVLDQDRRRDHEYRNLTEEERRQLEQARGKEVASYAAERIRQELQRKIRKHYAAAHELHVLIYLNVNASAVAWASIAGPTEPEVKTFASVWVITQDIFCCIHGGSTWHGLVGWKRINAES